MLIVPKTTRRALNPEIGTSVGWPRSPHAAQRREEQEVRSVLEQLDTTRWQLADFPADLLFSDSIELQVCGF